MLIALALAAQLVTYTDPMGARWCASIAYLDPEGPGGVAWAWLTLQADPRRIVRAPLAQLAEGC